MLIRAGLRWLCIVGMSSLREAIRLPSRWRAHRDPGLGTGRRRGRSRRSDDGAAPPYHQAPHPAGWGATPTLPAGGNKPQHNLKITGYLTDATDCCFYARCRRWACCANATDMFQDLPGGTEQTARRRLNWRAAVGAGIGAGILATGLQIALWAAFSSGLPEILFRDARLAAAIVMGPKVLAPPATLDWYVMLIATLVHFTLSIAYGLILSRLIVFLGTPSSLLAGVMFGLLLYALNMYGF